MAQIPKTQLTFNAAIKSMHSCSGPLRGLGGGGGGGGPRANTRRDCLGSHSSMRLRHLTAHMGISCSHSTLAYLNVTFNCAYLI